MTLNEYQKNAVWVRTYDDNKGLYPAIKLFSEAGEVADEIAKIIRYGDSRERRKELAKELGDVLGSIAYVANDYGFTLQDIADIHIEKIKSRIENNSHQPFEKTNTDGY